MFDVKEMTTRSSPQLIEGIYDEILEPNFDRSELDKREDFCNAFSPDADYDVVGLYTCGEDGDPTACVIGYPYVEDKVLLIGYLAATPRARSQGHGRALIEAARDRWFEEGEYLMGVAEVEDPRFWPSAGGIDPHRRVAFYERNGAEWVLGPYFQPRLHEDSERVYDMFLCSLFVRPTLVAEGARSLKTEGLVAFIAEYFDDSEEIDSRDDPESRWLLDYYESRATVPLVTAAEILVSPIPRPPGRD